SLSLGRLDQYLHPFYQADLADGRLNKAEAEEIVQALWLKFGALKGAYQNVTLGGCDADGNYLGNDLTVMGLRASARLKMDQPLVSFRWHPAMPEALWEPVLDLIGEGLGFPAMFNDEVVIDAKCRVGLDRADAADYGAVGCVEMTAGGREWSQTEAVRINWAKALELMLNDGVCMLTGTATPFRSDRPLAELAAFDDFLASYKRVFGRLIDMAAEWTIVRDEGFPLLQPTPFLSSTMTGCLECGRDVSAGGTTYNLLTMNSCGMADTADSLLAIKHLVYDRGELTLAELVDSLRNNFAGADDLRASLADAGPHFGTDRDEADLLVKDLAELLHERLADFRNVRGGGYQIGMYTVDSHAWLGKATGALPSGRPAGVSLASGLSPRQGADTAGPTAVVRSLTKLDHSQFGNGMVLDIKFSPSIFDDLQGRQALRKLIETYFTLGGLEIQFNVIDRKTLLAAQSRPEEFRDLVVRVSGFSAYFVDLDSVCQDEIIARTEHV
ncbi:MAG: pyruvate formate lyase family protein, partial [Planctomycetota bacterium]